MKHIIALFLVFLPSALIAQTRPLGPFLTARETPNVYYVEMTGNDSTAVPGDPSHPYQSGSAAFMAAYVSGRPQSNAMSYTEVTQVENPETDYTLADIIWDAGPGGYGGPIISDVTTTGAIVTGSYSTDPVLVLTGSIDSDANGVPLITIQTTGVKVFTSAPQSALLKFGVGNWTIVMPFGVDWPSWILLKGAGCPGYPLTPANIAGYGVVTPEYSDTFLTQGDVITGTPGYVPVSPWIPSGTVINLAGNASAPASGTQPFSTYNIWWFAPGTPTTIAIYGFTGDVQGLLNDGVTPDPNGPCTQAGNLTITDAGKGSFAGQFCGGWITDWGHSGDTGTAVQGNGGNVTVYNSICGAYGGCGCGEQGATTYGNSALSSGNVTMYNCPQAMGWGANTANRGNVGYVSMTNCTGGNIGGQGFPGPGGTPLGGACVSQGGWNVIYSGQPRGAVQAVDCIVDASSHDDFGDITLLRCIYGISIIGNSSFYDIAIDGNQCVLRTQRSSSGAPSSNAYNASLETYLNP